ncbi:MAG: FecR domain-containing protein [Candidatus Nitronauta litoralis]|uniref:FecR domain-containing protein n=1 Tax=Candidatus Nitronauta litoralis TaxID=2705533 RepID=A0A7T0BWZ4_9BACT|nr:MAG: FecR domain-containing protein [Candidatus Nitronauta litoralis]
MNSTIQNSFFLRFKKPGVFFIALIGTLFFGQWVEAQEDVLGRIISIRGTVEFQSPQGGSAANTAGQVKPVSFGPWQKVQPKQEIHVNDRIRTSRKSRLKILFKDKSLFAMGPKTEITLEKYLFQPDNKLRQSVVNIAHGLSMYIINKESINPDSKFEIKTPTAILAARGTKGFFSATSGRTLLANQAGAMNARNVDPQVVGNVNVGIMMKSIIEAGKPPTTPAPLLPGERILINRIVNGFPASSFSGEAKSGDVVVELGSDSSGTQEDFTEFYEFFDDSDAESCSMN